MPLHQPDPALDLSVTRPAEVKGARMHRLWRRFPPGGRERPQPWYFSSVDPAEPEESGRFDLPEPQGSLYMATTAAAAVMEAIQDHLPVLPVEELEIRRRAEIEVPVAEPDFADLTDPALSAHLSNEVWAGGTHTIPQAWATAFAGAGWPGLQTPCRHGLLDERTVIRFGPAGTQAPTSDGDEWSFQEYVVHDDYGLVDALRSRGVRVAGPANLPVATRPQ